MKFKVNNRLIPRKQIGGLIPLVSDNTKTTPRRLYVPPTQEDLMRQRGQDYTKQTPFQRRANLATGALTNVSPEFALLTGGVGAGLLKGVPGAMVHGGAQGAIWNASNLAGEQSVEGLATDVLGGALIGGAIKGAPTAAKYLKGQYYKRTFNPLTVNVQKYKGLVAPDEALGGIDKFTVNRLQKKIDKISTTKGALLDTMYPLEDKISTIKSQNKLKSVSKALHSPSTQLGKTLGAGGFGEAYQFKYNPDYVVKFGGTNATDQPLKLAALGKQFASDPNIAIPLRVEQLSPDKFAWVMKKVPGKSPTNFFNENLNMLEGDIKFPRKTIAEAALKIRSLNKAGIGFDYAGDNLLYDLPSKKFSLIDLNVLPDKSYRGDWFTKHINKTGQNPASVLKEKFEYRMEPKATTKNIKAENYELFSINNLKRPNGAIGTQGVTTEQVSDILKNVLNLKPSESASMRDLVNLFTSNKENVNKLLEFTKKNPIKVSKLPDATFHLKDGHHRTFLLDQAGIKDIPTVLSQFKWGGKL